MKNIIEIAQLLTEQRKKLGIEQKDMYMLIGMKQQQYQRIEAGSDVKLSTLLRILDGLDLELSIIPKDRITSPKSVNSHALSDKVGELKDDTDDLSFWLDLKDNS